MKVRYNLIKPTAGIGYAQLLALMGKLASYCSLVMRNDGSYSERARTFLRDLATCQSSVSQVSEWPGTRLLYGGKATLYCYNVTPFLIGRLTNQTTGLFDWLEPDLPEDLCFYRQDKSCILTTISHENDAYFDLLQSEFLQLEHSVSDLILERDSARPYSN